MTRSLESSIDIAATPEQVWAVVSDLKRMPEWSPNCRKMLVLGTPKVGTFSINVNRDGWKVWPTTARIVRFEPNKAVAFKVLENGLTWSFDIEPTPTGSTLVQRRTDSADATLFAKAVLRVTMGGIDNVDETGVRGMSTTLDRIKQAVEKGA